MRYFLDTEFNGFGDEIISLALVGEDGRELYLAREFGRFHKFEPWVAANVLPIIQCSGAIPQYRQFFGFNIAEFLGGGGLADTIVADWPDDIVHFCRQLITGPGRMVDISGLKFSLHRVDAYPTDLPGAVQHNALWDARALRRKILGA